jgi:hypothetical protein
MLLAFALSAQAACVTTVEKTASDPSAWADISKITLKGGPCFGSCPVYIFQINSSGELYDREIADSKDAKPVLRKGRITPAAFRRLAEKYQAIDFSPPVHRSAIMHPDHSSTYIIVDRYSRQIVHTMSGTPPTGLRELKAELINLRKQARWEAVNGAAAPAPAGRK